MLSYGDYTPPSPHGHHYHLVIASAPTHSTTSSLCVFQISNGGQREEATATVSEWTPAAEPRYLDNRYVAPHAPSLSTTARRGEQQQQQQQQATRVSDYSSLYSPPTNLAVSKFAGFALEWKRQGKRETWCYYNS